MRTLSIRRDLGLQLLTLYLVFLVVVSVVAFLFMRVSTGRLETRIGDSDLALANVIAEETYTTTSSALAAVQKLGENQAVIDNDSEGMENIFHTVLDVRYEANLIYRLDETGLMSFHYPIGPESTVGQDFSFREYFQRARNRQTPFLSSGRISPTTNQPVATAVMPLWSEDDEFLGVVAMNIKLQFLSNTLTNITTNFQLDPELQIAIIDHTGQIIAHSDTLFLLQNSHVLLPDVAPAVLDGQKDNLITHNLEGEEQIYSFVPIESIGWGVIISRPTATAFEILNTFRQGVLMVTLVFLGSGLVFWWVLFRHVIQPLERLSSLSQVAWLENEESGEITISLSGLTERVDQMGVLTRSVQQMQDIIEAQLNQLSTLLKTSASVVSTLDSRVVLERILEQVEQLLDVQMSAIFALDEEAHIFRAQASRNLPEQYVKDVRIDPLDPNSLTMRAIRAGEPIQISDTESDLSFTHNRFRARMAGYRAALAIRLPVQHAPPSALVVYQTQPRVFTEREIKLLSSFANHAAMAIENATLFARSDMHLREQTHRLEALIQSMHDGLILEDSSGKILYANRRILELLDLHFEEIYQQPIQVLIETLTRHTTDSESLRQAITGLLADEGIRHAEFEKINVPAPCYLRLTLFDVEEMGRGWIFQDITRHREIDRMKSILIATASHELRTPLAAIKGYASTLLADDVEWDAESQREFLTIISDEADRLNNLVGNILDMSRIETGKIKVHRTLCELPEIIEKAVQHATIAANRVVMILPEDLPPVSIDPQRIETVLSNLIENAAKYSPDTSPIQVSASQEDGCVVVRVADEGVGISPEHQARVFETFYRIENGLAQRTAGAGLGLAIARSFIQAHGGQTWFEPRQKGTCIAFSILTHYDVE